MAFNKVNKLRQFILVTEIVNKHYVEGVTSYAGIWRNFVNPIYPMSYHKFMGIVNMPGLEKQLADAEEEQRIRKEVKESLPGQLELFESEGK